MSCRYAIYWAPPSGAALAALGEAWLGRSAEQERAPARPAFSGVSPEEIEAAVAEPRRYGLHATLKPPFRLAAGKSAAALEAAFDDFASRIQAVSVPEPALKRIGRFLALVPSAPSAALDRLAADCVARFDEFRAPPDSAELARRRAAGLMPSQEANLARWGYPYVMEDYRFHVSVTGAIEARLCDRLEPVLAAYFAPAMKAPLEIGGLALFIEPAPGAPFRLARRAALAPR